MSIDIFLGVLSFTGVVLLLVCIIIFARSLLVSTGSVNIEINDDPTNTITVQLDLNYFKLLQKIKYFYLQRVVEAGLAVNVNAKL